MSNYAGVMGGFTGSPSGQSLAGSGVLYQNSKVSLTEIPDGTSNTIMVGERRPYGKPTKTRFGNEDTLRAVLESGVGTTGKGRERALGPGRGRCQQDQRDRRPVELRQLAHRREPTLSSPTGACASSPIPLGDPTLINLANRSDGGTVQLP